MNAAAPSDNWGPWALSIGAAERLARVRALRAFVQDRFSSKHPLYRALYWAESLEPEDITNAAIELDRMPALDRRKLLSSYAALIAFKAQRDATPKPQPPEESP